MTHGLYAEYEAIRLWGRYSASPQYAPCPPGAGGGAGTLVSAEFKTSSIYSILENPTNGLYNNVFYLKSEISYFAPEPIAPPFRIFMEAKFMGITIPINGDFQSSNTDNLPRNYQFEFVLKKPKFFVKRVSIFEFTTEIKLYQMILLCEGYSFSLQADGGRNISSNVNIDAPMIFTKFFSNPSEMIFIGNGYVMNVALAVLSKEPCPCDISSSAVLDGGYSYKMKGENDYKSLPTQLEYRMPTGFSLLPSLSSTNTNNSSITGRMRYILSGTSEIYRAANVGINIIPNREKKFKRIHKDNNKCLVLRGTYPATYFKSKTIEFANNQIVREQKYPARAVILDCLEDAEGVLENELQRDDLCPYFINLIESAPGTNKTNISYYGYDDTSANITNFNDFVNAYNPNFPFFATLYPAVLEISFGGFGGSFNSFDIEKFSLIRNCNSFWNWVLYFPPDEDNQHWKLGVPLTKVNNAQYWFPLREQYLDHQQLPTQKRYKYRSKIKDTVVNNSDVAIRNGNWFNYKANYYNGTGLYNLYTPDEVLPDYPALPVSYLGFCNAKVKDVVIPTSKTADTRTRYSFENCVPANLPNGFSLTPTGNTVIVEYDIGNYSNAPYLYDIIADVFEYALTGTTIQNVKVYGISFSDSTSEQIRDLLYEGNQLSRSISKRIKQEKYFAGTGILDYNADLTVAGIDKGLEVDTANSKSTQVLSNGEKLINFSLLCSNNYNRLRFEITVSNVAIQIIFNFLVFKFSSSRRFYQFIESANIDTLADDKGYFRFGQVEYYDEDLGEILQTPYLKKPDYKMSFVDGLCHIKKLLLGEGYDAGGLRNELKQHFPALEAYPFEISFEYDTLIIDESSGITPFDLDTYICPITDYETWLSDSGKVRFLYGNYMACLPPNSCLPQYSLFTDDLSKEYVYVFTPYRNFVWNYEDDLGLYEVEYTLGQTEDDDVENNRTLRSYVPNGNVYSAYSNLFVCEYTRALTNQEVIKRWNNQNVRTPKWILANTENQNSIRDLTRITPFRGHTYNIRTADEQVPEDRLFIYNCWIDIEGLGDIGLGLVKNTVQENYYIGRYNIRQDLFTIIPIDNDRSADLTLSLVQSYLKHFSAGVYKVYENDEEERVVDLAGRYPSIVFTQNYMFVGVKKSNGVYEVSRFSLVNNTIQDTRQVIYESITPILATARFVNFPSLGILGKRIAKLVIAHHYKYNANNDGDVLVKFYSAERETVEEEDWLEFRFSQVFSGSVKYSFPFIFHLDNAIGITAFRDEGNVCVVIVPEDYVYSRRVWRGMVQPETNQPLESYYHPACYKHGLVVFFNFASGAKQFEAVEIPENIFQEVQL
jgi:hypothetical protein